MRISNAISSASRASILKNLQADILRLEGFHPAKGDSPDMGLDFMKDVFPNGTFPTGAVHEFLSPQTEDKAPVTGFIAGLLSSLMKNHGTTLWVSSSRTVFPPALKVFGQDPDRFIFLDLPKEKDVLWAMDEALKCSALSAVVGEIRNIDFTASRRLQLAVEQSQVTGFVIRDNIKTLNTTACISRWKIVSLPSNPIAAGEGDNLPGVGFPKWRVELLRMRNGKSGTWDIQWINEKFVVSEESLCKERSSWEKPEEGIRMLG